MSGGKSKAGMSDSGRISVERGLGGGGNAKFGFEGKARVVVTDKNGKFKSDTGWCLNTPTNAGKAACSGHMSGADAMASYFQWIAVGTDNTAENSTHTALLSEITDSGLARASDATPAQVTSNVADDMFRIVYQWTATAAATIREIGCFNSSAVGTMIGRTLASSDVADTDIVNGTYDVVFAVAA